MRFGCPRSASKWKRACALEQTITGAIRADPVLATLLVVSPRAMHFRQTTWLAARMQRSRHSKPPALVASGRARLTGGCCVTLRTCSKIPSQHLQPPVTRLPPAPQTPAPRRSADKAQARQGFLTPWRTKKKPRRSQTRFESPGCAGAGPLTNKLSATKKTSSSRAPKQHPIASRRSSCCRGRSRHA